MPALSQSVELAGGARAAYEVIGDGPPLFYFQGGPGFSAVLLRPEAELLADHFSVFLIDPAGSGGSTPPSDPSQYDHIGHARFYEDVRRALDVGPATIAGTSFGGVVALTYASLYPESTLRCTAIATRAVGEELEGPEAAAEAAQFLARHAEQPWYPAARAVWDEWTERVLAAEDASEVDAMMAEVLPLYTAHPDRPAVKAMIEAWRTDMRSDLAAIKVWESGLWQRIDTRELLAEIDRPTLVLVGALHLLSRPAHPPLIPHALPAPQLFILPDSGHFISAQAPDSFSRQLLRFAA